MFRFDNPHPTQERHSPGALKFTGLFPPLLCPCPPSRVHLPTQRVRSECQLKQLRWGPSGSLHVDVDPADRNRDPSITVARVLSWWDLYHDTMKWVMALGDKPGRAVVHNVQASSRNICHPMVELVWLARVLVQYICRGEKEEGDEETANTRHCMYAVLYICRAVIFEVGEGLQGSWQVPWRTS